MKFRKRPVEIEAHLWDGTAGSHKLLREWTGGQVNLVTGGRLMVHTLEGWVLASAGDWIIRGVAGEFYPCKPDIFTATYEVVS